MRKYRNYEEGLKVRLADSAYAKEYLAIALEEYDEDGNIEAFLLALRDVVNAQGGLSKLEPHIKLSRQALHEVFSENQMLPFETMGAILHGLGLKFSIEMLENSP
ncbi:MAG: transcriptional regulator [Candidatus Poribacteria bacterium]|nr:transcriptional regulator [Candidatus Poribacteria bacterium]